MNFDPCTAIVKRPTSCQFLALARKRRQARLHQARSCSRCCSTQQQLEAFDRFCPQIVDKGYESLPPLRACEDDRNSLHLIEHKQEFVIRATPANFERAAQICGFTQLPLSSARELRDGFSQRSFQVLPSARLDDGPPGLTHPGKRGVGVEGPNFFPSPEVACSPG